MLVKDMDNFVIKEDFNFMLITDSTKEVEEFLQRNKKRLILTSKK
jgi:hypothetical protein